MISAEQLHASRAEQRRLRLLEAEREIAQEEAEALLMTEEQRQTLLKPFLSVKAEFTDLDGFRWTETALRRFPAPQRPHGHLGSSSGVKQSSALVAMDDSPFSADDTIRVSSATRARPRAKFPSPLTATRDLPAPLVQAAPGAADTARRHRDGTRTRSPVKGLFPPPSPPSPQEIAPPRPPGLAPAPTYTSTSIGPSSLNYDTAPTTLPAPGPLPDIQLLSAPHRAPPKRSPSLSAISMLAAHPSAPSSLPRRQRASTMASHAQDTPLSTPTPIAQRAAPSPPSHARRLSPSADDDTPSLLDAPPPPLLGLRPASSDPGPTPSARARLASLLSHPPASAAPPTRHPAPPTRHPAPVLPPLATGALPRRAPGPAGTLRGWRAADAEPGDDDDDDDDGYAADEAGGPYALYAAADGGAWASDGEDDETPRPSPVEADGGGESPSRRWIRRFA